MVRAGVGERELGKGRWRWRWDEWSEEDLYSQVNNCGSSIGT